MDMTEKLFGPADSSFVSREQLFTLNAEIHQTLNIVEEYEMSEYEFGELFIQDLLDQTASSTLAQVNTLSFKFKVGRLINHSFKR